jgi:hypothetical protein
MRKRGNGADEPKSPTPFSNEIRTAFHDDGQPGNSVAAKGHFRIDENEHRTEAKNRQRNRQPLREM